VPEEPFQSVKKLFQQWNGIAVWEYVTIRETRDSGVPQGSCSGPGFWNILYNSLLNMDFAQRTRVIAFADDLLVLTEAKFTLDAENYAIQYLHKIENWARENKMHFDENKSKFLLVTKKTIGDNRTLNIYLNNKRLEQASELNI
jgi:hypothetical protein